MPSSIRVLGFKAVLCNVSKESLKSALCWYCSVDCTITIYLFIYFISFISKITTMYFFIYLFVIFNIPLYRSPVPASGWLTINYGTFHAFSRDDKNKVKNSAVYSAQKEGVGWIVC